MNVTYNAPKMLPLRDPDGVLLAVFGRNEAVHQAADAMAAELWRKLDSEIMAAIHGPNTGGVIVNPLPLEA